MVDNIDADITHARIRSRHVLIATKATAKGSNSRQAKVGRTAGKAPWVVEERHVYRAE